VAQELHSLEAGMAIPYGGNRYTVVPPELAEAFTSGDRLVVVQDTGDLLHIPEQEWKTAADAVTSAVNAFSQLGTVTDDQISDFYERFADRLADDSVFEAIATANQEDVESARSRGRSTTRLILSPTMREDMVAGLRLWRDRPGGRSEVVETVVHTGWRAELVRSGLGVVGFVFEGRPNVFADATGVLRSGNAVVFRIGSDALGTAEAIMRHALDPALEGAGLPPGTASLVASAARSAGWAMFSDPRLSLAVARGSGRAVAQLGAVARQAGIPVSLHGTGGAWIVASTHASTESFAAAVEHSLDRKVCNTLNTCCIASERLDDLLPEFLAALQRAADRRNAPPKLHVVGELMNRIPEDWTAEARIVRAEGPVPEPKAEPIGADQLGLEWEWEDSPEVTLVAVDSVDEAIELFNAQSPKFAASLISADEAEHQRFFDLVDSPFVGNGFTRWVDGQYALDRPELGLSNWQYGRLFGRGGVLSGDSVFTVRTRAVQDDPTLRR
jgi:glutamate-5-semialdehyde dehydrogenase